MLPVTTAGSASGYIQDPSAPPRAQSGPNGD